MSSPINTAQQGQTLNELTLLKSMKNQKIIQINQVHWDKIKQVFTKLYKRADRLYDGFASTDKIYKELGRYAEELQGLLSDAEIKEAETKWVQIWEQGFRSGIEFLYDRFYFLADAVEERINNGDLSEYAQQDERGYPKWDEDKWENEVQEYIAQQLKRKADQGECHYCSNYGLLSLGGLDICSEHESRFHEDYRWNKQEKRWEPIFDLLIEKDGDRYNLYPQGFQEAKDVEEDDEPEITLTKGEKTQIGNLTVLIKDGYLQLGTTKYELIPHPRWENYYGLDINPESLGILQAYCEEVPVRIQIETGKENYEKN